MTYVLGVVGSIGGWYAGSWLAEALQVSGDMLTLVPLLGVVAGGVAGASLGQATTPD